MILRAAGVWSIHELGTDRGRDLLSNAADDQQVPLGPVDDVPARELAARVWTAIRVGIGFLFVRPFLPLVRAAGASDVQIGKVGATSLVTCGRLDDSSDWKLPASVDEPGDYVLRATWNTPLAGGGIGTRVGETQIRFVEYVVDDRYKDKPSGGFFVESCTEAERDVSKTDEVPLGISDSDPGQSADLLDGDSSARFLGPGNGEMSLVPKPGFDWLVVGARKAPELLVFIGDPAAPTRRRRRRRGRGPGCRRARRPLEAAW